MASCPPAMWTVRETIVPVSADKPRGRRDMQMHDAVFLGRVVLQLHAVLDVAVVQTRRAGAVCSLGQRQDVDLDIADRSPAAAAMARKQRKRRCRSNAVQRRCLLSPRDSAGPHFGKPAWLTGTVTRAGSCPTAPFSLAPTCTSAGRFEPRLVERIQAGPGRPPARRPGRNGPCS